MLSVLIAPVGCGFPHTVKHLFNARTLYIAPKLLLKVRARELEGYNVHYANVYKLENYDRIAPSFDQFLIEVPKLDPRTRLTKKLVNFLLPVRNRLIFLRSESLVTTNTITLISLLGE